MALELDERQHAMLQEMGVKVWLPGTAFAVEGVETLGRTVAAPLAASNAAVPVGRSATIVPSAVVTTAPVPVAQPSARPAAAKPQTVAVPASAVGLVPEVAELDWPALVHAARDCQACGLCTGRSNSTLLAPTVEQADWMVVGDAPDEDEDRQGEPFAQASGTLLDNMLRAVGASRKQSGSGTTATLASAYVTNVLKCRPPAGHVPQAAELLTCAAYLQREIALVRPKVIVAMGRFAMQLLLSEHPDLAGQPLGKLRGSVYRYRGVPVVATYHPKLLLRNAPDKAKAWADLCLAMDVVAPSLQS